ncbi:HesB/YadR/YfhF family protein [Alkalicoccus chagannorensis]|uniref:HesB/YadR/YfhF family protein n=1 Tax=Alkalicoccus chagannorensis TaxID=427072 RepID=UPI00041B414C|nr:HesB/YadR/YfhF family protein [Alkalicoccus chagannorensis]
MELNITDQAAAWFKDEIDLNQGDYIKFFAKYGGTSPIQSGFSLAFEPYQEPMKTGVSTEKDGIKFFVEDGDLWYFDGHDLTVDYDQNKEEIVFDYHESS